MILRICVVIPYFDNPRTISQVVKQVVIETPYPVLVIDDGSETPVANNLYSFEVKQALENGRVRLVRFDKNQGKGAALQHALKDLVAQGFTHMMTIDGDGRHLPREIRKVVDEGRRHPMDLIVGNRGFESPAQTGAGGNRLKRWLQRVLSASVQFETGSRVQDTGSGFRLYPLFPLQTMKFRTKRYDFELEVLIRAIWNGVHVREVPIEIAPFDPHEHVEHFHRFWDSLRLSLLNLTLLTVSLLKTHNNPRELALAIGLGAFVGCTPAYGFHTVIVVALALVLRLNFVALWLGTHVSTPVIAPFVFLAEVYIGQHWLGITASKGMMGHFNQLLAGALVLGVILFVVLAAVTFFVARSLQNQEKGADLTAPSRLLKFLVRFGGIAVAGVWVRLLSLYRYVVWMPARRGLNEFYLIVRPELTFWQRQGAVLRHLQILGEIQVDILSPRRPAVAGEAALQTAATENPGLIVVSGHVGALNLCVPSGVQCRFVDRVTQSSPVEVIPFLGRLALFDVSAFGLSGNGHRLMLLESFGVRVSRGQYELIVPYGARDAGGSGGETPLELAIFERARRFVRQMEQVVLKSPEQWSNLFPFFSRVPVLTESSRHATIEELHPLSRLLPDKDLR